MYNFSSKIQWNHFFKYEEVLLIRRISHNKIKMKQLRCGSIAGTQAFCVPDPTFSSWFVLHCAPQPCASQQLSWPPSTTGFQDQKWSRRNKKINKRMDRFLKNISMLLCNVLSETTLGIKGFPWMYSVVSVYFVSRIWDIFFIGTIRKHSFLSSLSVLTNYYLLSKTCFSTAFQTGR